MYVCIDILFIFICQKLSFIAHLFDIFMQKTTHISAYSVLITYTTRQQSCTNTLYIVFDKEYFGFLLILCDMYLKFPKFLLSVLKLY